MARISYEFTEGTMGALDASEMGAGKTLVACEVVYRAGYQRVLYVGIKDTYKAWANALEGRSEGTIKLRRMDSTRAGRLAFDDFMAGHDGHFFAGSQFLTTQDWTRIPDPKKEGKTKRVHLKKYGKVKATDLTILDEVHVFANRQSNGIGTVRSIPTARRLAMSGTFFGNKFSGAHTICRWVWPLVMDESEHGYLIDPSSIRWVDKWCVVESPTGWDGEPLKDARGQTIKKVLGEKEPGEFVKTLPCYIRNLSPVGAPPEPEIVHVTLSPAERADYDQMESDSMVWLPTHPGEEALVADIPAAQRQRLRTAALGTMSLTEDGQVFFHLETQSSKMVALKNILSRPDWAGEQGAIYMFSKRFAKVLVARMRRGGYSVAEYSGDTTTAERDEIKRQFLAGELQYIVATISTFGTGLDGFQDVCNRVVWVEESDNPKDNDQAINRFWRFGGDTANFQHIKIVAKDTLDEGVIARNNINTANNRQSMKEDSK